MAVEASRITGRFKALFPKANLSNKRLDALAARLAKKPADDAEDSAIDEVLNEANEIFPFDEMAREEHKLINAENQLKKRKASGNPADEEDTDPPADPPQDPPANQPAWVKDVLSSNKKLEEQVQQLLTGKILETKKAQARTIFDKNETLKNLKETVKEKWFNRIDVNSEVPVEEQITELETEYADLVQTSANDKRVAGAPPNGDANGKPTDNELDSVAGAL